MENKEFFEKSKLIAEIQEVITLWLNERPEVRSVASLSRSTAVADSSIRRLLNNGIKIQDDSIFKLLAHVAGSETFESVQGVLSDKVNAQRWFKKHFAYLERVPALESYQRSENQAEIVSNPIAFAVYALISSFEGIDSSYIREQYGIRGEQELENLIQNEVVVLKDNKLAANGDQKLKLDKFETVRLLPEITRTYLKADSDHNGRALEIEGVSKDGYGDLLELFGKFLSDVHAIYKAKPGDIPTVVAGFVDTFTTHTLFEGGKNETPH